MGMYTELFFRAKLTNDLPDETLNALRVMTGELAGDGITLPEHPLFACHRWELLGQGSSYYFPDHLKDSRLTVDPYESPTLVLSANLKNYDDEIDKFFDWIDPYVDASPGEFLGYSLYEDVEPETPPFSYFKREDPSDAEG